MPRECLQTRSRIVQTTQEIIFEHPVHVFQGVAFATQPHDAVPGTLVKLPRLTCLGGGLLVLAAFLSFLVPGPSGDPAASEIISFCPVEAHVSVQFFKILGSRSAAISLDGVGAIPEEAHLN